MSDVARYAPMSRRPAHALAVVGAIARRTPPALACWLCAILAALLLDRAVAEWVHRAGLDQKAHWTPQHTRIVDAIKLGGTYPFTLLVALAAGLLHPRRHRAAGLVALAGIASGLNVLLKWSVGRYRPVTGIRPLLVDPFAGGLPGMVGSVKNLSFPSGHACLAFATAHAMALLFPRARWAFYAVAIVVGAQRISENAHYLSDVVAGAACGVLAAHAMLRLLNAGYARRGEPALLAGRAAHG